MLDLEPAEEHLAVAELSRSVGLELLFPAAREAQALRAVPARVWRAVLDTGLTVPVPEERGGPGVPDTLTQMIAVENLAYGDPGIALAAAWSGAAALVLARHGSAEQEDLLWALLSDPDARGSVALFEGFGRGASGLRTTVGVEADGTVVVRGDKVAVPFIDEGVWLVVVGMDPHHGGLRAAVVPRDTPGLQVGPRSGVLALEATGAGSVSFDVRLPSGALLGGPDADPQGLASTIERVRLLTAAVQIGTAQRAIDYAAAYAVDRVAFGKPIAGFQSVSFPLAEAQIRIEELRLELGEIAASSSTTLRPSCRWR